MKKIPGDKINIFHGMDTDERTGMFAYDYLKKLRAVHPGRFFGAIRPVVLRMDGPTGVSRIGDMCTTCLEANRNLCVCDAPGFKPGCDFGKKFSQLAVRANEVCRLHVSTRLFAAAVSEPKHRSPLAVVPQGARARSAPVRCARR